MKNYRYYKWMKLKFFVLFLMAMFVFGLVVMLLWNWLIPTLFSGPEITYWQGIGLLLLSRILLGGFSKHRHCGHGHPAHWKKRFEKKWDNLSPEKKEKIRQKFKNKCGEWMDEKENTESSGERNKDEN
jgi:hypothetical protein